MKSNSTIIKERIFKSPAKRFFYQKSYEKFSEAINLVPKEGLAIEIGSGIGLTKYFTSDFIITDVNIAPELDCVVDGKLLPFKDNSLKLICMLNVFHHVSNVESFLNEVSRCLKPKGRLLIIDQHVGLISKWVLKYIHHEKCDDKAESWSFKSNDPAVDANGALTWIVFRRDIVLFKNKFPNLSLVKYETHTPLFIG